PEAHRPAARRAPRALELLGLLRRPQPDVLPDARLGPARHAAADLHLPPRPRLGLLEPALDDRGVHARGRDPRDGRECDRLPAARRDRGGRPVGREHARVVDVLAAAGVQLRVDPRRAQRRPELGRRGPRRGPPPRRAGRAHALRGARDDRHRLARRRHRGDPREPDRVAVAAPARARAVALLRRVPDRPLGARGRRDGARRGGCRRLESQGAWRMSEQLAVPVARQRGRPLGWWGVLMLVATEAVLFAAMIASYFYIRFKTPHWPPPGVPEPKVLYPMLLTLVLVCTSVPTAAAQWAARRRQPGRAASGLALTAALAAIYAAGTTAILVQEWHAVPATRDAYDSLFFTIQGAHVAHVAAGILINLFFLGKLARGRLTRYRVNGIWAMSLYWHFVNALAIFVLLTAVSPAL